MPTGYTKHVHTRTPMHSHAYSRCTTVPKLNSIHMDIAYQSCCTECIIYIHKLNFILIVNYTLCFKEMHCVNRINCCDWIDGVTFDWMHMEENAHTTKMEHLIWMYNYYFLFSRSVHCGVSSRVCKTEAKIWITSIFRAKSWPLSLYSIKTRPLFTSFNLCVDAAPWWSRALITPSKPWSR